jgi:hypothetical protein
MKLIFCSLVNSYDLLLILCQVLPFNVLIFSLRIKLLYYKVINLLLFDSRSVRQVITTWRVSHKGMCILLAVIVNVFYCSDTVNFQKESL